MRASSAPVDTRLFAQSDSIIIGPMVNTLWDSLRIPLDLESSIQLVLQNDNCQQGHSRLLRNRWWSKQCFFFSRNVGQVTPKIIYFHYLIKYFPDQSIQKTFYLILRKEALIAAKFSSKGVFFSPGLRGMQNSIVKRFDATACARSRCFQCNLRMANMISIGEATCL